MLTIFTIPKPFQGNIGIIQKNAIQSWLSVSPQSEIILLGDEEGVAETAEEFGISYLPEIKKNEFSTPFLDSALGLIKNFTKNPFLLIISSDIILIDNPILAILQIKEPLFLMGGQRWDFDVKETIRFDQSGWREKLRTEVFKNNKPRGFTTIDYFIFPRHLPINFPPFVIGRAGWDNWLIYKARSLKIPVIDATEVITAIHQNHGYSHSPWGRDGKLGGRVLGPELKRNLKLAGGSLNMFTLRDADWLLTFSGLQRPSFPRIIFSKLSLFLPWRAIIALRRKLREFLKI